MITQHRRGFCFVAHPPGDLGQDLCLSEPQFPPTHTATRGSVEKSLPVHTTRDSRNEEVRGRTPSFFPAPIILARVLSLYSEGCLPAVPPTSICEGGCCREQSRGHHWKGVSELQEIASNDV